MAGLGARIRANRQLELLRCFLYGGIERGPLRAADFDFFGDADGRQIVVIQIEDYAGSKQRRVFAEVLGAQQALLFRSDCRKEKGARRHRFCGGPDAREFEQNAAAGGIVRRAVIDVRAGWLGLIDAEVVIVRRVENGFGILSAV